jgi:hypothetical protein
MAATGGKVNSKDDDGAILNAIILYWCGMSTAYLVAFLIVRLYFPVVATFYTTSWAGNKKVPVDVPQTIFGWVKPTATISKMKDLWKIIGLDLAMALEFPELCLKISLWVAGPMILITCPINFFIDQGGEDLDFLSSLGTANLGQSESPIWWAHAVIVWIVVIVICKLLSDAEASFVSTLNGRGRGTPLWVGVRKSVDGTWYNIDGTFFSQALDLFYPGEPNGNFDHAQMGLAKKGADHSPEKLNDVNPGVRNRYVCEWCSPEYASLSTLALEAGSRSLSRCWCTGLGIWRLSLLGDRE